MLRAMECGVSRGIFTNEAGLGCSVMAYGESGGAEPGKQGCWGILQVFIDTILMCTLSALAILVSGALSTGKDGAALSTVCFSSVFGSWGKGFVCISITLFAFATLFLLSGEIVQEKQRCFPKKRLTKENYVHKTIRGDHY